MRLNKTTNHAVRILCECAKAGADLKTAADIAVALDITPQNTVKIVHGLIRAGFLQSVRGRNGGVRLAQSAENIYIGAVVRETEAGLADAPAARKHLDDGFDGLVDNAFAAFLSVLDGQTLADLVATLPQSKSLGPKVKRSDVKRLTSSTGKAHAPTLVKKPRKSRGSSAMTRRS